MMQYSMLDRRPEEWFDLVRKHHASIVTRGTLAKGLLTSESLTRAKDMDGYGTYSKSELIEVLTNLNRNTNSLHALAISYVLKNQEVASILAGASSSEQIEKTIHAYHHTVNDENIDQVMQYLKEDQYKEHRI